MRSGKSDSFTSLAGRTTVCHIMPPAFWGLLEESSPRPWPMPDPWWFTAGWCALRRRTLVDTCVLALTRVYLFLWFAYFYTIVIRLIAAQCRSYICIAKYCLVAGMLLKFSFSLLIQELVPKTCVLVTGTVSMERCCVKVFKYHLPFLVFIVLCTQQAKFDSPLLYCILGLMYTTV